jgi:hypothetical protein
LEFEGEGDDGVCLIAAEGPALWSRVGGAAQFYQLNRRRDGTELKDGSFVLGMSDLGNFLELAKVG